MIHLSQFEHLSVIGLSVESVRVVVISPRNICGPIAGLINMRFFPMKPRPALTANDRSASGTESTQILNLCSCLPAELINSVSLRNLSFINGW